MKTRFNLLGAPLLSHILRVIPFLILFQLIPGPSFAIRCLAADSITATNVASQAMMHSFLKQEAVRLDATFLDGITNRQQWEAHRTERRQNYLEMLGLWPLPGRTPLEPVITGVIEREEGFRVEKLHFQSRPHLYVTGNLYLPRDAKPGAKLPAVLYVCGHSGRGRDGNKTAFQHHGMWFATHGYACLLIDTLQLGEIAAIHHGTYRYDRWWWQARGYTPAAVECWNGVRAIDYLQGRPEIDPDRIAVTGISGGGAATFWIAATDERVKVAVPVSGNSDLQDYVGEKVVNGHCDCMFCINTFQWPWTQIAALIVPRPMLFENSGHDTIFPMNGNDRIRARLEKLYGFYTNRTDRLFDIGVTPGGHDDKPELRLMAYRWINRFLKGDDSPVTEPEFPKIEGKLLRAFPDELPADEINTRIDESFVPVATGPLPQGPQEFQSWRAQKLAELRRIVFRSLPERNDSPSPLKFGGSKEQQGLVASEPGVSVPWKYFPARTGKPGAPSWLVVLGGEDSLDVKPAWLPKRVADAPVLLVAPRGDGPMRLPDPAPYYIQRSLPLLGRTLDSCRLADVLAASARVPKTERGAKWNIIGRGRAGVIAAYAALLEPRLGGVAVVDPPASHREGPIFLNVLRVLDVPEALGMLAPRPLTIYTANSRTFDSTASIYRIGGGELKLEDVPPRLGASTPAQVLAGLREFYARTARADGSFANGLDPQYRGMSDSAHSDLAAVTYAVTLHKTFGWKLPFEERTIEFLLARQRPAGDFFNVAGTVDPASAEGRVYNTTQGLVALRALGRKPRHPPLALFEDILQADYKTLPPFSTSFFPLAYLAYGEPIPREADRRIRALMVQAKDGYMNDHVAATFHAAHYHRLIREPVPMAGPMVQRTLQDQHNNGSWLLNPPARDRHATFDAVFILWQLGQGRADCRDAIQRAERWVLSCRNSDGGFGHFPGSPSDADANYFQAGVLVMSGYLKPADPLPKDPQLLSWGHLMPLP